MKHHKHGDTGTRLYRIWKGVKCRCLNANHPTYKSYGGRGITISPEWIENYPAFKQWAVTHGYNKTLELDRINVNGNYCPENCRWTTHHEQTLNRRDTLVIIVDDQILRFRDFCLQHGFNLHTINAWRYLGIEQDKISEALGKPVKVLHQWEVIGNATHQKL